MFYQILPSLVGLLMLITLCSAYRPDPNPCDKPNTCHQECELVEVSNATHFQFKVWCHCFEGYEFSGQFSQEGYELCDTICYEGTHYWNKYKGKCEEIVSECQSHLHDNSLVLTEEAKYPNIRLIGRGYDLMIGDPYAELADPGLQSPIFSPFAKFEDHDFCILKGYSMDPRGYTKCEENAKTFKSSKELYSAFEGFMSEGNSFEEGTVRVTDSSSARLDRSKSSEKGTSSSQGSSLSSSDSLNWEEGGGSTATKDEGIDTDDTTNSDSNACKSESSTQSEQKSHEHTVGKTVQVSDTKSKSSTKGGSDSTTNTEEYHQSVTDESSSSSTVEASVSAGWGPFSASASASLTISNSHSSTSGSSNTNSNTIEENYEETEMEENQKTEGTEDSQSDEISVGNDQTEGSEKCSSTGKSNALSKRLAQGSSSNEDWRSSTSQSIDRGQTFNEEVSASRSETEGTSTEKGQSLEYEIKGFKQSFIGTSSFSSSERLIKSSAGSVSVSNSVIRHYGAEMKKDRPAFTNDFIKEVRYLNAQTLLVGQYDGGEKTRKQREVTELFDDLFVDFIKTYGTHFSTDVEMGARRLSQMRFTEEETQHFSDESRESCVKSLLNDGKAGNEDEKCKVPSKGNVKTEYGSVSRSITSIFGSIRLGTTCEEWTKYVVGDKSVRIKSELQPITTLFTEEFMPGNRIATNDGRRIDVEKISGWFLLRYINLCKYVHQIYSGKSELPSLIKACKERESSCSLWSDCKSNEICVLKKNEKGGVEGYKCQNPCYKHDCRGFEECVPSQNEEKGFRCEDNNPCLSNPCKETEDCVADLFNDYSCIGKCKPYTCGEFENCIYDNTKSEGFRCDKIDFCAKNPCRKNEVCTNDYFYFNGYKCTDVCDSNPCDEYSDCIHDSAEPKGYKCKDICTENTCREHVETCYPDKDSGYYCFYNGCPKENIGSKASSKKNICYSENEVCIDDEESTQGYKCVNRCDDNPCKEHVEACYPDYTNDEGYYCEWVGCPTEYNACEADGYDSDYKCVEDYLDEYPGYTCILKCDENSCRKHVETCIPTDYEIDGKYHTCKYTGCPMEVDICDGQGTCQEDEYSEFGYECVNECDSEPCREHVEVCQPDYFLGHQCHYYGCPYDKNICGKGYTCVDNEEYSIEGYDCEPISVNCQWGDWSQYSTCSRSCEGGTQTRSRSKSVIEQYGGTCSGLSTETRTCSIQKCPGPPPDLSNIEDWTVNCELGVWNVNEENDWIGANGFNFKGQSNYPGVDSCFNWYGWTNEGPECSINTTFSGIGQAYLSFGNCWKQLGQYKGGVVKAYLDGVEIESVGPQEFKVISINYTHGSTLEIRELNTAIIQLN